MLSKIVKSDKTEVFQFQLFVAYIFEICIVRKKNSEVRRSGHEMEKHFFEILLFCLNWKYFSDRKKNL